jgi:hypothetical protein
VRFVTDDLHATGWTSRWIFGQLVLKDLLDEGPFIPGDAELPVELFQ